MTKISIITINFNNLEGLKKTVESVINQTWQEFEYIIIDGGSIDGSAEYIESKSQHINYWVSEPDKGIYNAMNKGILKATGEYLLFLNSGDHLYNNNVLEQNHNKIVDYDLITFDMLQIGNNTSKIISLPEFLRFSDLYFQTLPHPSTLIKKMLFHQIGYYDENLKIVSDWKFFILALFKFRCSYKKINQTFSVFYLGGLSFQTDYSEERCEVIEKYFSEHKLDCEELKYNRIYTNTNRFKMLIEIEKTFMGKKIISLFFRIYIVFFSKKKLSQVLNNLKNN